MTRSQPTIATPDGEMPAHLWLPEAGTGPGLVLLQEIFGISRYVESRAQDLADLGYVVLAPEIYWRIGTSRVPEGPGAMDEALGLMGRVDWEAAVGDAVTTLAALRERPEVTGGAGVIGFCFGGGLGFNVAAVGSPDVLVAYYGSAIPQLLDLAPLVTTPSLHHLGLADAYIEGDARAAMLDALGSQPATRVETYEGADHAFDNPDLSLHHAAASVAAWEHTVAFLAEQLPTA
ncbi:dienelactone hydrolase family protein [Nocardioides aurantiacus]|uniref:dienelactone hydrolase family protein n=1 Tax=Nocardioides aurantiacus TaxID=86796 RepID=UPI00403FB56E